THARADADRGHFRPRRRLRPGPAAPARDPRAAVDEPGAGAGRAEARRSRRGVSRGIDRRSRRGRRRMRLQLIAYGIAAAGAIAVAPRVAAAQPQVDTSEPGDGAATGTVSVYADDDDTTVVTSMVDGSLRLPVPVLISAHALVDAVSSASVDIVSAATGRYS